ncbi:MAG: RNA 2',3'-cyclic phosphodiesterase [Bacillota bacterium]|jgi:2'-5' RNA ligase|nr:RNA 2',3'-cyclic phosphodiesterase [Bacillota bacterium]HHU42942.1 RNA 2',3'-cyclic phosphodiesterase [Clostridiales bacterium]
MRVFIAVDFDNKTKDKLFEAQSKLKEISLKGRFAPRDNFHLTLVFIGEVQKERIEDAISVMKGIETKPFEITLEGMGSFKNGKRNVFWLRVKNNIELESLQKRLYDSLAERGFELQKRKFAPHITLARDVTNKDSREIFFAPFSYRVSSISLMRTVMGKGKTYYEELFKREFKFKK